MEELIDPKNPSSNIPQTQTKSTSIFHTFIPQNAQFHNSPFPPSCFFKIKQEKGISKSSEGGPALLSLLPQLLFPFKNAQIITKHPNKKTQIQLRLQTLYSQKATESRKATGTGVKMKLSNIFTVLKRFFPPIFQPVRECSVGEKVPKKAEFG